MTTNLKAEVRARVGRTGEKYTEARRGVFAGRKPAGREPEAIERVTIHTTHNGWPLASETATIPAGASTGRDQEQEGDGNPSCVTGEGCP